MGLIGTALEFGMVLDADVEIAVLQLHGLHNVVIRGGTADGQTGLHQRLPEIVVEFVAVAVIAFARFVAGMADANSGEFDPDSRHKVIDFLPDQSDETDKGGTLRLGAYPCRVVPGTQMHRVYGKPDISERHRHRYEFNNDFREALSKAGLTISGTSPDNYIVETVELEGNDFYIGVQYHPEFKSRPNKPHPLFLGLVEAALKR